MMNKAVPRFPMVSEDGDTFHNLWNSDHIHDYVPCSLSLLNYIMSKPPPEFLLQLKKNSYRNFCKEDIISYLLTKASHHLHLEHTNPRLEGLACFHRAVQKRDMLLWLRAFTVLA